MSPTEALAARYRHLFVLPSKITLLVLNAVGSVVLSAVAARGPPPLALAAVSLVAALLVPFVIAGTARVIDQATIATFRRSLAATFAGTTLWLLCGGVGLAYALSGGGVAFGNSLIFGAFLCGGFETLVVGGAFVEQMPVSVLLGAMQPAMTAAAILLLSGVGYSAYAVVPGVVAFTLVALFTVSLKRKKTSRGYNAVKLFQAFMKTWTNKDASELESIIASHAEKAEVASKVLRFQGPKGDLFLVLPGIHPGPFYPVGSYNMPGLISRAFEGAGAVLALHRPGGHEMNLATNADAKEYAQKLRDFAVALNPGKAPAKIRGPTAAKVGKATATLSGFMESLFLTVSFAPYGSDDLEPDFERQLAAVASDEGFDASIVDAHNSIDDDRETSDPNDPQWRKLIQDVKRLGPSEFRVGYAHSQEKEFPSASDITANGIGLAVLEAQKTKWVLALADANNAVPGLRSAVSAALESSGYKLLEFCTSDSHDLAARGLTVNRGYKALGEATPVGAIVSSTVRLAKLAESRLSECGFAAGAMTSEVNIFGATALDEFAGITRESSAFAKNFARFGVLGLAVLLMLSLVL